MIFLYTWIGLDVAMVMFFVVAAIIRGEFKDSKKEEK